LEALAASPLGAKLSLGGAFALAHYHEFRATHDLDAWWDDTATSQEQQTVVNVVTAALSPFGQVLQRRHGDVISIELVAQGKTVFSFQIARRSALLHPLQPSPWPPVKLDSLQDLLAAKMTALIERGAPRDFLDIRELCRTSLAAVEDCWRLWHCRESARGVRHPDHHAAAEAILLHLSRIERIRPLDKTSDPLARQQAAELRTFFKHEFCRRQLRLD
jgi:hypothetical protein